MITISKDKSNYESIKVLFKEYFIFAGLDVEKGLSNFDDTYFKNNSRLFLAKYNEMIAGCVGLIQYNNNICEVQRLYVRPECQGNGIGKELMFSFIDEAKLLNYSSIRLYTLPKLDKAIKLYFSLGFKEILPYRENLKKETLFMELCL